MFFLHVYIFISPFGAKNLEGKGSNPPLGELVLVMFVMTLSQTFLQHTMYKCAITHQIQHHI